MHSIVVLCSKSCVVLRGKARKGKYYTVYHIGGPLLINALITLVEFTIIMLVSSYLVHLFWLFSRRKKEIMVRF